MMNTGLPEMLHCLNSKSENSEMSVVKRQIPRLKWQQEQLGHLPPPTDFNGNGQLSFLGLNSDQGLCEMVVTGAMKSHPSIQKRWNVDSQRVLNCGNGSAFEMSCALPRTVSCPPNVVASIENEAAMISSVTGKESCKKRKTDKTQNLKVSAEEKKMKGCAAEESKATDQNSISKSTTTTTVSTSISKNNKGPAGNAKQSSKAVEAPPTDYFHVRARRGQATDSHSLAERVRREKISERMNYLQELVPGCNKVTGKAGMLDEIINYVQSLQRQVEFLSMKLAAINPRLDFNIDNYLVKEIFPACTSRFHTLGESSSSMVNHGQVQFHTSEQGGSVPGLEMLVDHGSVPQTCLDPSSLSQIQHITWEGASQNLYSIDHQEGRWASFISQPITGFMELNHVKLEM